MLVSTLHGQPSYFHYFHYDAKQTNPFISILLFLQRWAPGPSRPRFVSIHHSYSLLYSEYLRFSPTTVSVLSEFILSEVRARLLRLGVRSNEY
jgi:hypothetical protein